jgi:hypothetical protein
LLEAAIIKGKKIGLSRDEIIDMASLMDKNASKIQIEKIVDRVIG